MKNTIILPGSGADGTISISWQPAEMRTTLRESDCSDASGVKWPICSIVWCLKLEE